jgi:hypothetical protein
LIFKKNPYVLYLFYVVKALILAAGGDEVQRFDPMRNTD